MKEIYQQTVEEVLERVNGKKSGLTSEQVKRSVTMTVKRDGETWAYE